MCRKAGSTLRTRLSQLLHSNDLVRVYRISLLAGSADNALEYGTLRECSMLTFATTPLTIHAISLGLAFSTEYRFTYPTIYPFACFDLLFI